MLYTIGYSGLTLPALQRMVEAHDALLVDIRDNPASRRPGFAKKHLHAQFGTRYVHCQALGNVHYKTGGPIVLRDYPAGLDQMRELLRTTPAVLLLCVCAQVETCHRKVAGEQLSRDLHVPLVHLAR